MARLTQTALIGVILALSCTLYISHLHSASLQQKISDIQAQSDTMVANHILRVTELTEKYESEKAAIYSRHNSIVASLREQSRRKLPAVTRDCESEYRGRAERVYAELLGRYANVAKYADELKLTGGNCEALRD